MESKVRNVIEGGIVILILAFLFSVAFYFKTHNESRTDARRYELWMQAFDHKKAFCESRGDCVRYSITEVGGKTVPHFEACVPCPKSGIEY